MFYIEIFDGPEGYRIKSNIASERIPEILGEYLHAVIGAGEDVAEPNQQGGYRIRIELDLEDDTFRTKSDTGNAGLTAGIVLEVFQKESLKYPSS